MVKMNRSERVAKHVIETIHSGAWAEFSCTQSNSEYDFHVTFADGRTAALEVTISTNQKSIEMLESIKKRGSRVPATACRNSWLINYSPKADTRAILKDVDRYLAAIEAEGLSEFFADPGQMNSEAV
jgi:hypothetical protein